MSVRDRLELAVKQRWDRELTPCDNGVDRAQRRLAVDEVIEQLRAYPQWMEEMLSVEFVGWLCPCHRRVVRPNPDGSKPDHHLISKDEGQLRCNISPDLWQRTYVLKEDT